MKILYLSANPEWVEIEQAEEARPPDTAGDTAARKKFKQYSKLNLWQELRAVTDVLFEARSDGSVILEVVPEARRSDVVRYVDRCRPNVMHFSGHGEDELIILSDDHFDGQTVSEAWLKEVLAGKNISILLFNCCWSGSLDELAEVADVLIGTTNPLPSDKAAEFAETFYASLQHGVSVKDAFEEASRKVGEGLYEAVCNKPEIWEKPLWPQTEEKAEDSPRQKILGYQNRLNAIYSNLESDIRWDINMVGLALVTTFIAGLVLSFFEALPSWAQYEPGAIMTALVSIPAGRWAGHARALMAVFLASEAVSIVSIQPEPKIVKELELGRLDRMFRNLKEYEE